MIRELVRAPGDAFWPLFLYELYDLPEPGSTVNEARPSGQFHFEHEIKSVDHFEITEDLFWDRLDEFDLTISGHGQPKRPSDIYIWFSASEMKLNEKLPGAALLILTPVITWEDKEETRIKEYRYTFKVNLGDYFSSTVYPNERPVGFLGGAKRMIWIQSPKRNYNVEPPNPKQVGEFVRFFPAAVEAGGPDEVPPDHLLKKELKSLKIPTRIMRDLKEDGLGACAFDESIGRLVLATAESPLLHVLDYADHM